MRVRGAINMKRFLMALAIVSSVWLALDFARARAAPCLIVKLTGTHSGPLQPSTV
jgi:hypothetical protein